MKRILSIILIFILLFGSVACGNKAEKDTAQKADKYCTACGNGVSLTDAFCPKCGNVLKNTVDNSSGVASTDASSPDTSSNDATSTNSKVTESVIHTHSYTKIDTPATCTKGGYSEYTCSCGHSYKDSYTDALGHTYKKSVTEPTCETEGKTTYSCWCGDTYSETIAKVDHEYENGKCVYCNIQQPNKEFDTLKAWLTANGELFEGSYYVDDYIVSYAYCSISYHPSDDEIHFYCWVEDKDGDYYTSLINIDRTPSSYEYVFECCDAQGHVLGGYLGSLNPPTCLLSNTMPYDEFFSDYNSPTTESGFVQMVPVHIKLNLLGCDQLLSGNDGKVANSNLTTADFGFVIPE